MQEFNTKHENQAQTLIKLILFLIPQTSTHTGLDCVTKLEYFMLGPHILSTKIIVFAFQHIHFTTLMEFLNNLWGLGTE
jgi:hypothetical protein